MPGAQFTRSRSMVSWWASSLLEGQPVLGPVPAVLQRLQVDVRRGPVQGADGFMQRWQAAGADQLGRQQLRQGVALIEPAQGRLAEVTQALLRQPFGGGIDGREGGIYRRLLGRSRLCSSG